eukprot:scaffold59325_cov69-Phaeocystis_antarctica.AAC.2
MSKYVTYVFGRLPCPARTSLEGGAGASPSRSCQEANSAARKICAYGYTGATFYAYQSHNRTLAARTLTPASHTNTRARTQVGRTPYSRPGTAALNDSLAIGANEYVECDTSLSGVNPSFARSAAARNRRRWASRSSASGSTTRSGGCCSTRVEDHVENGVAEAPAATSASVASEWPEATATSRGVNGENPSLSCASRDAPAAASTTIDSAWPCAAAAYSGVRPFLSFASRDAPAVTSTAIVPACSAMCSGVAPSKVCASRDAPADSSNLITSN